MIRRASLYLTHIEGQSKVGIKTGQEHEEGSDEVVDGGGPRVRREADAQQVDQGHNGTAQVLKQFKSTYKPN